MDPVSRPSEAIGFHHHCRIKAGQLRATGFGQIHPGTVAYLLHGSASEQLPRCRKIALLLAREPGYDGEWHEADVALAYQLRKLSDAELDERLHGLSRPALPPQAPAVATGPAAGFTDFLKRRPQSAPPR